LHLKSNNDQFKQNKNMKKRTFWIAAMVMAMLSSCGGQKGEQPKAPTKVKTQVVSSGLMDNTQTYVGMVEECEATAVSFTSMGVVKRVWVDEGQTVSRGQLIAEMDDAQARNMLSNAQAQMVQANDAYVRMKLLYEQNALADIKWWRHRVKWLKRSRCWIWRRRILRIAV
jgi:multidrug efflux pump subunit AcrA (membrane-fusion protein)